jgi:hypothetical protein
MNTSKESPEALPFRLADALDFLDDPSDFSIGLAEGENGGDEKDLTFLDASGLSTSNNDTFFACGFEHGATHLIHARSFETAWETWVDELPTIPEEELIEAYGAEAGGGDYRLIDGYEMQSNFSGTGIVSMGHYAWMREVDPSDIVITRRPSPVKE